MMDFMGEVFIRLLLACGLFASVAGAVTGTTENIRGASCIGIILCTMLYCAIEFRAARSGK
jgi:hypothetical protein